MQTIKTFQQMVMSSKGITPITSLRPGDYVFDAITGAHIPILDVRVLPNEEPIQVTYSDGRGEVYHPDQYIVTHYGVGSISYHEMCMCKIEAFMNYPEIVSNHLTKITQNGINIRSKDVIIDNTDIYLIAPFIVFGDLSDPYMNLPSYMTNDLSYWLKIRPNMVPDTHVRSDKVYFLDNMLSQLRWEKSKFGIFDELDFSIEKYLTRIRLSKLGNVCRFIRAICDINIDRVTLRNNHVINIKLYDIPEHIAEILRDMIIMAGVTCKLEYMIYRNKRIRCIRILGGDVTALVTDEDIIADILKYVPREENSVSIDDVKIIHEDIKMYQLIVPEEYYHKCYLSPNIIPMVFSAN